MAYRIVKRPQAWWPVEWDGVAEDGTVVTNRIELRFYLIKVDEGAQFLRDVEEARARETEEGVDLAALYASLVGRVASDWRGVEAENGEPLKWDDGNLRLLLNEPGLFVAIFAAFRACLAGRRQVREGN